MLLQVVFLVLGIVSSIVVVSLVDKCNCVGKCLLVLNRYSFPIYLLHVLLEIIVGIGVPIICMKIIKNCKILLFVFYPPSRLMRIRKNKLY